MTFDHRFRPGVALHRLFPPPALRAPSPGGQLDEGEAGEGAYGRGERVRLKDSLSFFVAHSASSKAEQQALEESLDDTDAADDDLAAVG